MNPLPILLLPGMDGTGDLFREFVSHTPRTFAPRVVPLPDLASYDDLLTALVTEVPPHGKLAILGDSFSGPLAVRLAAQHRHRVAAVILCNSFIVAPRTSLFRFLPWRLLFAFPPPAVAIRVVLAGRSASNGLVEDVRVAAAKCGARTLAARLSTVLTLQADSIPLEIACPVLALHGTADRLVPSANADAIVSAFPHCQRRDMPGPHLLLQTHPVQAWAAIEEFVRESGGLN